MTEVDPTPSSPSGSGISRRRSRDVLSLTDGSVTNWITSVRTQDDPTAVERLWRRCEPTLLKLGRRWTSSQQGRAVYDEHDLAQHAFYALYQGLVVGKFPDVRKRDDLWRLLAVIATRKGHDQSRRLGARKRSGGKVAQVDQEILDQLPDESVSPDVAAAAADECRHLLDRLQDPTLEQVAMLKLTGRTNEEIADETQYSLRSVHRMLKLIREVWMQDAAGTPEPE